MKSDVFRKSVLGRWSSHPVDVAWRTRWLALGTVIPVIFFAVILLNKVRQPSRWLSLWENAATWGNVALLLFTMAAAMLMTLALMGRLNRWNSQLKKESLSAIGWLDPWMMIPAVLLAFFGPFYFATIANLSPLASWVFRFIAFMPLTCLIALTGTLPARDDSQQQPRRQTWLLVIAVVFLLATVMTTAFDLAITTGNESLASRIEPFLPGYRANARRYFGLIVFGTITFIFYVAWRVWKRAPTQLEKTIDQHTSLSNLWQLRDDLLAQPDDQADDQADDQTGDPDKAAGKMSGQQRINLALYGEPHRPEQELFSQTAIDRFLQATRAGHQEQHTAADLALVSADHTLARVTQIVATIQAIVQLGTQTIWLLPADCTVEDEQHVLELLANSLKRSGLDWLISGEVLTIQLGVDWEEGQAVLPSVLIANPVLLRQAVLDNTALSAHNRDSFLSAYGRVVIDDTQQVIDSDVQATETLRRVRGHLANHGLITQFLPSLSARPASELVSVFKDSLQSSCLDQPINL